MVADGPCKGMTINELVAQFREGLVEAVRRRLTVALCLMLICFSVSSCRKEYHPYLVERVSYDVDGTNVCDERYSPDDLGKWWRGYDDERPVNLFDGYKRDPDSGELVMNYDYFLFDLVTYNLSFKIHGDGSGPFKEGAIYESDDYYVQYYPEKSWWEDRGLMNRRIDDFDFKRISGIFSFSREGDYLIFKFDFSEVITSVLSEGERYEMNDTIVISNGVYTALLYRNEFEVGLAP